MVFALLFSIGLGINGVAASTSVPVIVLAIMARALLDIALPKRLIGGTDSHYKLFLQQIAATGGGNLPRHPWISFLIQSAVWYIPLSIIAFFVARHFST